MTDDERDYAINVVLRVALEAQTWTAALKEVLVAKGITTDEEFARFVAAAGLGRMEPSGDDSPLSDWPSDPKAPKQ